MTTFRFTLTVVGADLLDGRAQEALYEAGCNDATFGISSGVQTAEFDREAEDFSEAVATAIKAIETSVPGAEVVNIHRERDLATPN